MTTIFKTARRSEIYYKMGFHFNGHEQRFAKAPFDLVMLPNAPVTVSEGNVASYIDTKGLPLESNGILDTLGELLDTDISWASNEEAYLERTGFGWIGEPIYVDEHLMGNFESQNNWLGVHKFSQL